MPQNRPSRAKVCPICHSTIFDRKFETHVIKEHGVPPGEAKEMFAKALRKGEFGPRTLQVMPDKAYKALEQQLADLRKQMEIRAT